MLALAAVEAAALIQGLLVEGPDVPGALEPLHHATLLQLEHDLHTSRLPDNDAQEGQEE